MAGARFWLYPNAWKDSPSMDGSPIAVEEKPAEVPIEPAPEAPGPPPVTELPLDHQRRIAHQALGMLLIIDRARQQLGEHAANLRTRSNVDPKKRSECLVRYAECVDFDKMLNDLQAHASKVISQVVAKRPELEHELGIVRKPSILTPGGV